MRQFNQNNHLKKNANKKDKAYFTSKSELLSWINSTLNLDIKALDQTITGAIFCQLLDAAHPGTVRMNKVNWKAKLETEYISNFKIFQQALLNNNIDKPINITRLSKGKTQELIELLQWLYGHHISLGINPANYDAKKKRNGQNLIFCAEKVNNMNVINNKNIRDDLSYCSSSTNFREYQMKNNLKNKANKNNINSNLNKNNFQNKYSNPKHMDRSALNNKNKIKETSSSYNFSSNHSRTLSASSNNGKKGENNLQLKSINNIATNPFTIKEQAEESMKEYEEKQLNDKLFDGISNVDKDNILEMERNDGNNVLELKVLLRKLRVSDIMFKNNIGIILNKIKKEREFYLNKLKDIEYLYLNPLIKNKIEDKNILLKTILSSKVDTTVHINDEGIASIIDKENNYAPKINVLPKENDNNKTSDDEEVNKIKNILKMNDNEENKRKKNSKKEISIKYVFSKNNQILLERKNGTNRTQPDNNLCCNKNDTNFKGLLSFQNNILKSNKGKSNKIQNDLNITTKNNDYNISSLIFNESLHIPNNENERANFGDDIDFN